MRQANEVFMNKWPDPGKDIVTNGIRPSHAWTRAVYYEGLMALYSIDPKKEYYDYASAIKGGMDAHAKSFQDGLDSSRGNGWELAALVRTLSQLRQKDTRRPEYLQQLYVASAEGDKNSDPRGEFLSAVRAGAVYHLFKKKGLETDSMPAVGHPVGESIRYHIRAGKHDITLYDWQQYMDFTDRWLR